MISKIRTSFALTALILIMLLLQSCHHADNEVTRAVKSQLERYPESGLQDIYKSFFQDEFGPGHLLTDTAGAWQYLEYELSEMTSSGNHAAEPCGTGQNFYRVPLDLVKDGIISDSVLFSAFMEGAASFRLPDIDSWKKRWEEIELVIEGMNVDLPDFEADKQALDDMLNHGETAVHHSRNYEEIYKPHYRIVGKEQWGKLTLNLNFELEL
jgi:hypothetical protein